MALTKASTDLNPLVTRITPASLSKPAKINLLAPAETTRIQRYLFAGCDVNICRGMCLKRHSNHTFALTNITQLLKSSIKNYYRQNLTKYESRLSHLNHKDTFVLIYTHTHVCARSHTYNQHTYARACTHPRTRAHSHNYAQFHTDRCL